MRLKSGKNKKYLRDTNRLNFKIKFEKTTFTRNASMNLEAKYKLLGRVNVIFLNFPVMTDCRVNSAILGL